MPDKQIKYQYKCIHTLFTRIKNVSIDSRIESIFNKQMEDGWEYYNTTTTEEIVPAGCFGALFGKKDKLLFHYFFVFRKPIHD